MTLQELLAEAVEMFGNQGAVGEEIGVDRSRVSRAMKGEYSFEVDTCLRLARALGRPASVVLQAAGKQETAALIEALYDVGSAPLSERARHLAQRFERLASIDQNAVERVVDGLSPTDAHMPRQKRRAAS